MTEMVFGTTQGRSGDPILPRWWRTIDKWTLACVVGLYAIGLLLGLAASVPLAEKNGLPQFYYVTRQAFFGGLALAVALGISMMNPRQVRRLGVILCLVALTAVMFLPLIGTSHGKGAVRWLSIAGVSAQPVEFLKPGLICVMAWFMAASYEIGGPPGRLYSALLCLFVAVLLALQPDFGQASLIAFSWAVMYFVAGSPISHLLVAGGAGGALLTFAYSQSEHVARRIDGFLNSEIDPRTQIGYATNAIREGGWFGAGVGEGSVKWSLPDAHTDFIIAVAAEEYGLMLVVVILALYMTIVVRSLARLMSERDPFARIAGTGLACAFGMQAFINMGVAARLLPAKGMTLPFISYGGSSVVASGILCGMLLALTRARPQNNVAEVFGRAGH